jgi:uncharacterized protein YgbK (DUF1537 family)
MPAPQLVILADDLTGAADTGGSFGGAGMATAAPFCDSPLPPVDVLAISSECRDIDECDVPARMQAVLSQAVSLGQPERWYKKIDSGLRGHPGLEIALTMESQGFTTAIIAPALPAEGRVTLEGRVYVHGLPLHTTPLGEGASSFIVERLQGHTDAKIVWIGLDVVRRGAEALLQTILSTGEGWIIIDATTDEDLLSIAGAAARLPDVLLAGSAGFASALMQVLPLEPRAPQPPPPRTADLPMLTVAGTRHDGTLRQIEHARRAGMTVIRPPDVDRTWTRDEIAKLSDRVSRSLASGLDTILTITGCPPSKLPGTQLDEQLAAVAAIPCMAGMTGSLMLTGGDTAAAVCARLDARFLWLRGEVLPAIPWATLGTGPLQHLPIVTKAGSFGGPEAITTSAAFLRGLAHL